MVEWERCEDFDLGAASIAFFRGVATHEQGAKLWEGVLRNSE